MAEPTIVLQINDNTEGSPNWVAIDTSVRWTGSGGIGDSFPSPVGDGDEAWFDDGASPDDGEFWHDTTTDSKITVAGRNTNRNVIRALETGGSDPTADPPELTAYDDDSDAASRTSPSVWVLVGTSGTSSVSCIRGIETTGGAPGAPWTGMSHDVSAYELQGNTHKIVCSSVLAASGNKTFNLAACAPHDATSGLSNFVYCLQYTYE